MIHARSAKVCDLSYGSTFKTLSEALDACIKSKNCNSVNYDGSKFTRAKSLKLKDGVGSICYVKGGKFIEANGYMWDHHPNKKLTGAYNDIVYKTDKEAYSKCAGSTDCKGVTQHADNKYRLNTGIMPVTAKGKHAYIQGSKCV